MSTSVQLDAIKQELLDNVAILDVFALYPDFQIPTNANSKRNIIINCPVCGHNDCFRIVPDERRWQCQSDNHPGRKGSNCIDLVEMMEHKGYKECLYSLSERFRPDLLPHFNGNGNGTSPHRTGSPIANHHVQNYWKGRGLPDLPTSVNISKDGKAVFYNTYTSPDQTNLFQYAKIDDLPKRLAKTGDLEHELYVPEPWQMYKDVDELYLVEGIPDALTYYAIGQKAIAAFNVNSVNRKPFQQELTAFLAYTTPKTIIIVPDPDGFVAWKTSLSDLLKAYAIEFVDMSLWLPEYAKIDSNSLYRDVGFNSKDFLQALAWVRRNSTEYSQTIGQQTVIKRYDKLGYFKETPDQDGNAQETQLTNFLMFFRHFSRDVDTQEGKVNVTFQYDWRPRHRVTKTVDSKILGDQNKFKELIASVKHTLFIGNSALETLNFFEDKNYQHRQEIKGFEKFGQISDDLVLFRNVAIYKGRAYHAGNNGLITIHDTTYQTLLPDAPSLTLHAENHINQKMVRMFYNTFGLNGVLSLAFDLASIRMKSIIDRLHSHPNKFLQGGFGIGKSKLEREKNRLFGVLKDLTCKDTRASLERITNSFQYVPITLNEFKPEHIDAADFLEKAYDRQIKNKAFTDNSNRTKDNTLNAIISVTSNYTPEATTALHRRNAYLKCQQADFRKEYLNDLEKLVKCSDLVLRTYTLKLNIDELHENARQSIVNLNADATVLNNYAPFLMGLDILHKLKVIDDNTLNAYRQGFLEHALPNVLETITEETLTDSFLKDLHSKSLQIRREGRQTTTEILLNTQHEPVIGEDGKPMEVEKSVHTFETEIMPGIHYALKDVAKKRRLDIDLAACVDVLNRYRNGNKFDKHVLAQTLIDTPYFHNQPKQTKIGGQPKYKAIQLDYKKIQARLGLTFRASAEEPVTNALFNDEGKPSTSVTHETALTEDEQAQDETLSEYEQEQMDMYGVIRFPETTLGKQLFQQQQEENPFLRA